MSETTQLNQHSNLSTLNINEKNNILREGERERRQSRREIERERERRGEREREREGEREREREREMERRYIDIAKIRLERIERE